MPNAGALLPNVGASPCGIVAFVKLGKKKKPEANKPAPDADYEEAYGDEPDILKDDFDESNYDD